MKREKLCSCFLAELSKKGASKNTCREYWTEAGPSVQACVGLAMPQADYTGTIVTQHHSQFRHVLSGEHHCSPELQNSAVLISKNNTREMIDCFVSMVEG